MSRAVWGGAAPPGISVTRAIVVVVVVVVVVVALMLPCCRKLVPTDFRYGAPSLGLATIRIYAYEEFSNFDEFKKKKVCMDKSWMGVDDFVSTMDQVHQALAV